VWNRIVIGVGILLLGIGSQKVFAMSEAIADPAGRDSTKTGFVTPRIEGYGAIMPMPQAVEPPRAESRAVFDITGADGSDKVLRGLNSIALFLNLAAAAGVASESLHLAAVFHGPATKAVLRSEAYAKKTQASDNPNLELIKKLKAAGVAMYVCGQALAHHQFALQDVVPEIEVAVSATTVLVSRQMDGYAYLPYH
jgi:intracellular sulfur oxidation DsrE/DsrF family protein